MSTGIRDEFTGSVDKNDLMLSDRLWTQISNWVKDYSTIILMSSEEKSSKSALDKIDSLDRRGMELIEEIKKEIKFEVKIRYYSEGKFCYLSPLDQ